MNLPSKKIRDIRGERFGRLVVRAFSHVAQNSGKNAYWICDCDCGKITTVSSAPLRTGSTTSCGCYATEQNKLRIKNIHNRGNHLYFARSGPFIKIGRTTKLETRLVQLQAMNPNPVDFVRVLFNEGFREKEFHEKYKHRHHTGKWFRLDVCEI